MTTNDDCTCEGCGKAIRSGDKYTSTVDGCDLCEDCAPSYQDCVDHWVNRAALDGLDEDELEAAEESHKALVDHLAAGGAPNDKPLWIME